MLIHPELVDASALQKEREEETGANPAAGRLASQFAFPAGRASMLIACVFLAVVALALAAVHFLGTPNHH